MKKGEIYEGIIESIDFPNKGNVWVDAGDGAEPVHVIVKNGIPGQKIRFQIHKKRKNRCEGRLPSGKTGSGLPSIPSLRRLYVPDHGL